MNNDDIDIAQLTVAAPRATAAAAERPPRRVQGYFVRGPVPWAWIAAAARLPGRALHIGMSLWFRVGRSNDMTVSLSLNAVAAELGFDRSTASRALAALSRAGLVSVEHGPGRNCAVTVHMVNDAANDKT